MSWRAFRPEVARDAVQARERVQPSVRGKDGLAADVREREEEVAVLPKGGWDEGLLEKVLE